MERGNFSAAAGFGAFKADRQGVFRWVTTRIVADLGSTFSAFSEMIISELTMARLNFANVLTHFSHSGVDEMADNTWYARSFRVAPCLRADVAATLVSTSSSSTTDSRTGTRPSCTSRRTV